jgi:hypothetical protein
MPSRLDRYVDAAAARLSSLPEREREWETVEVRAHLETLASAHEAAGRSRDRAEQEAIRQFGAATAVGRGLRAAYFRRHLATFLQSWPCAGYATAISLAVFQYLWARPIVAVLAGVPNMSHMPPDIHCAACIEAQIECVVLGIAAARLSGPRAVPALAFWWWTLIAAFCGGRLFIPVMAGQWIGQHLSWFWFMALGLASAALASRRPQMRQISVVR